MSDRFDALIEQYRGNVPFEIVKAVIWKELKR